MQGKKVEEEENIWSSRPVPPQGVAKVVPSAPAVDLRY